MSKTVDERVVKAVFDNSEFEKYANQTIETLGRFENAIGKVATGVDLKGATSNIVNGMKSISDQIEKTGKKYSWLEQIAIGAYRKIGESVINFGKNEIMKLTGISQATAGWQKYESEVESVQTIMNATGLKIEEVEKHLKKLGWYTDETSYKYGDMVANIAKFNAAGISDLEKATDSMIGIANMAGYFGVNANKATGAMEGFAKAMGMGYMDQISWKRVETAGMNAMTIQKAFLDTAVELGKLRKKNKDTYIYGSGKLAKEFKASEFKNFLRYKWLDQEVMNNTFQKYSVAVNDIYKAWLDSGETATVTSLIEEMGGSLDQTSIKALKAAQETKTFSDAIGALEEVVASGWRTSFKYIFGNYEEAKEMWSGVVDELWDVFAGAGYKRNDLLKGWYEGGGRDKLLEGVANMWYGIKAIIDPIKQAFDTIFPSTTIERLLKLTDAFKNFSEKFRSWFDFGFTKSKDDETTKTVEKLETFEDAVKRTQKNLDKLYNEVNAGKWGHMWDRWKALGEAGYVWQIVQNEVNKRYTEAGVGNYPNRYAVKDDGTVKLKKKTVKATEEETEATNKMTAAQLMAERRSDNLMRAMRGLFAAVDIVKDVFEELGKFFGNTFGKTVEKLSPTFDRILKKAGKFGDFLYLLRGKLTKIKIGEIFEAASEKISDAIAWFMNDAIPFIGKGVGFIVDKIKAVGDILYPIVELLVGGAFYIITSLPGWIKKGYQKAKPFLDGLKNIVKPTIDSIESWINGTAIPFIKDLPNQILPFLSKAYDSSKKLVTGIWDNVINGEGFKKLKSSIQSVWTVIKNFAKSAWNTFKKYGGELYKSVSDFFDSFKTEEGTIDWGSLLGAGLDWAAGKISDFISSISNALGQVQEFYQELNPDNKQNPIEGIAASVSSATDGLNKFADNQLTPLKKFFTDVFEWAKGVGEFLKDPLEFIVNGFKTIIDNIVHMFDGLDLEKLANIFKDSGIGLFFGALGKNMLTGELGLASIPTNLSRVLLSLRDVFVSYSKSINANSLLKIGKAIGLLSLSIVGLGLAFQSNPQMLTDVVGAIALLGLVAAFLVRAMALYEEFKKVKEVQEDITKNVYNVSFVGADMVTAFMQPMQKFFSDLGFALGKKINAGNTALRFIALAVATMIIFKTIKDVNDFIKGINTDEARERLGKAALFVGGAMIFIALLGTLSKMGDNKATIGGALSFLTMASAVKIMLGAIAEMSKWPLNEIGKGVLAGLGIASMIVLLALALGQCQTEVVRINLKNGTDKYGKTKNPIFGMVALMLGFAVAVRMLAPAFETIGRMDFAGMFKIGALIMGLGILFALLGQLAKDLGNSEHLLKGIGSMFALITMVTLLVTVFTIMGVLMQSQSVSKVVASGILTFAVGIIAIAAAAAALEKFGANTALVKFADAISKFGFGIIAASAAIYIFGKALPSIIDTIQMVGDKLADEKTRDGFIRGITLLVLAILAVWLATKTQFFQTIWGWLKGGLEAIQSIVKPLLGKVAKIVTDVFEWFHDHKVWFTVAILGVILLLFSILDAIIPTVVDRLFKLLIIIILSLAKTIKTRAPQLLNALWLLVKSILSALGGVLGKIVAKVDSWFGVGGGADPDEFGKEVADKILPDESIDKALDEITGKTDKLEEDVTKKIKDAKKNIQSEIDEGDGLNLTSFVGGATGGGAVNALVKPVSAGLGTSLGGFDLRSILGGGKENIYDSATEAFSAIPDAVKEQFGVAGMDAETGMMKIDDILKVSGMAVSDSVEYNAEETVADVNETVDLGAQQLTKTLDENGDLMVQNVEGYYSDLGSTEDQALADQEDAIRTHRDRMYNVWDEETQEKIRTRNQKAAIHSIVEPIMQTLGEDAVAEIRAKANLLIQGFIQEFKSENNRRAVWSAGSGVVKHLMASIDHTAEIKSPSRAAAWRGLMIVAGFARGAMNNVRQVEMAGAYIATAMLDSVSMVLDEGGIITPTLTPVINASSIKNGIGMLDSIFGRSALSSTLASDAFKGFNQNQILKQEQIQNINSTNADVVAALGLLRGDVNNLNESMGGLQVVMDSGQLVGAIAQPMDNALGRRNIYKGRGI